MHRILEASYYSPCSTRMLNSLIMGSIDLGRQEEIAFRQAVDVVSPNFNSASAPTDMEVWVVPLRLAISPISLATAASTKFLKTKSFSRCPASFNCQLSPSSPRSWLIRSFDTRGVLLSDGYTRCLRACHLAPQDFENSMIPGGYNRATEGTKGYLSEKIQEFRGFARGLRSRVPPPARSLPRLR